MIKKLLPHFLVFCVLLFAQTTNAQLSTTADTSKMSYNQFSTLAGLYVYPSRKQTSQQQKKDEFECYKWAVQQTGYDPANPTIVKADTVKAGADGTVAKKIIAGTAIGSVSGEAGTGAAIGAAAGIKQKRMMQVKQQQQAQQNAQQKQQMLVNNYKNAFSACMEGKGYTVK